MEKITLKNSNMHAIYDTMRYGFISIKSPIDDCLADFVITPEEFPQYDVEDAKWLGTINGMVSIDEKEQSLTHIFKKQNVSYMATENKISAVSTGSKLTLTQEFEMKKDLLEWTICLENNSESAIKFLEVSLPLLMDQYFRNDNDFKYEHCVLRHTCITGNSSYLYWEKSSGNEPILLMLPLGDTQFLNLEKEQKDKLFGSQFGDGYGYEGLVRVHLVTQKTSVNLPCNSFVLEPS